LPRLVPTLDSDPDTVLPGGTLALTGTGFAGVCEGSCGGTNNSPSDVSVVLLQRQDDGRVAYAPTTASTPTSLSATVPSTTFAGSHRAWVIVNGMLSGGQPSNVYVEANGTACAAAQQGARGHCAEGFCCDTACAGPCDVCDADLGASATGTCTPAPAGYPGSPTCAAPYLCNGRDAACPGSRQSGVCAFPDIGAPCGTCAACDGAGRCTEVPLDDADCGAIDCSGLDTAWRAYQDVTTNRCAALGVCKAPHDPATCTVYSALSCGDGAAAPTVSGSLPGAGAQAPITWPSSARVVRRARAAGSAPLGTTTTKAASTRSA
jgi:hypothetical protein